MQTRAATFLIPAFLALGSTAARAEMPWLEPGDIQARQDVETLKAAGYLRGPISWPLPWRQLDEGVERALAARPSAHVRAAANRLAQLGDFAAQSESAEVRAAGTNRAALVRPFGYEARNQGDISFRVSKSLGKLYVSAGAGYRPGQLGKDYHADPSYATFTAGNWIIYGGYVEKYIGPGYDGALLLGNAARPFPKVGIQRVYPYRPKPKFLRWIGPWRFDAFGGVLNEKRPDGNNPAYLGMTFGFEPVRGLEVNLKRTLLICGDRRSRAPGLPNPGEGGSCGASDLVKAIFPFFPGIKPGDSLAGVDISYTRMLGPVAAKFYYDAVGEDKAGFQQFEQVGQTGGASLTAPIGGNGASVTLVGEYTDTLAHFLFQSDARPASFYTNTYYFTGKYYSGQSLGHSIGGDSKMMTLSASVTNDRNRRFYGSYRELSLYYTNALNVVGTRPNPISSNPEYIKIVTAGTEWPTAIGDVRAEARYMTDRPNTPGVARPTGEFELSWRTRF